MLHEKAAAGWPRRLLSSVGFEELLERNASGPDDDGLDPRPEGLAEGGQALERAEV